MTKYKATVVFDYDPEASDELTLRVGDVLTNIKHVEEGWCQGVLNGKTGMFPDNFVKMEEDTSAPPKTSPDSFKAKKIDSDSKRLMKVTFEYCPQNNDELKLSVGDIVEVLKDEEEGWAYGVINDQKGVFPTNFCVPHTENVSSTATEESKEPEPSKPEINQIPPKKVQGVGFGNIFGAGPITLKNRKTIGGNSSQSDKAAPKKPKEDKTYQSPPPTKEKLDKPSSTEKKSKAKPVEKCKVTFDYEAQTTDELTLVIGDIITIINKNCEDDGWWEGEIVKNGKKHRGVFPDNFVTLLPVDEKESNAKLAPELNVTTEKPTELEKKNSMEKDSPSSVVKSNGHKKTPPPPIPAASAKPKPEEDKASDLDAVVDSSGPDDQLSHFRRVSGPKNRRKPGSIGRRERAKEAAEEVAAAAAKIDSEPELESPKAEPEPVPTPQIPHKKESTRGIQVMPNLNPGADAGEKPAWMKNLRNRSSKRNSVPPSLKTDEGGKETPDWLSNLRKKPKPGDKTSPVVHSKPGPGVTPPKPTPTNKPAPTAADTHVLPTSPTGSPVSEDVAIQSKRSQIKENSSTPHHTPTVVDGETKPDVKKQPIRPPPPNQTSQDLPKKPVPTKPKPPPAKAKPALPGAKPQAIEELKEELKALKEQIINFRAESAKEISQISLQLEQEKSHRINLENEIAQLRKKIG